VWHDALGRTAPGATQNAPAGHLNTETYIDHDQKIISLLINWLAVNGVNPG
jgi:hypothetical protein